MGGLEPPTSRIRTGYSTKLSYTQAAWWYGWEDSNPRQPRPKRGALAKLSYTRMSRDVRTRPVARPSALRSEASRSCWLRRRDSNPNYAGNNRASYRLNDTELARRRGFEPREAGFGDRPVHQAHSARTDHYIPPYPCSYIPSAGGGGRSRTAVRRASHVGRYPPSNPSAPPCSTVRRSPAARNESAAPLSPYPYLEFQNLVLRAPGLRRTVGMGGVWAGPLPRKCLTWPVLLWYPPSR